MNLVGRDRELARIAEALGSGRNIALSGRFGSGRTTLIRHLAETSGCRFRFLFVDFSAPPREAWGVLAAELLPADEPAYKRRGGGYRVARARVLSATVTEEPAPVVVVDNIGRLTAPRLDFVRRLTVAQSFHFVAILEKALPATDRERLLGWLAPVERLRLGPLPMKVVRRFLAHASAQRGLVWSPERVAAVALATAGHPLAMRLVIEGRGAERRR